MHNEIAAILKQSCYHALQVYSLCRRMRMPLPSIPRRLAHVTLVSGIRLELGTMGREYLIYSSYPRISSLWITSKVDTGKAADNLVASVRIMEASEGVPINWQALLVWSGQWLEWIRSRHEGLLNHQQHQERQFKGSRRERAIQRAMNEAHYLMQLDCF